MSADPATYPIPPGLARMPRDKRGYPITYTVLITREGLVDFTTTNPYRWDACLHRRLCGMCGLPLKRKVWFVGGPLCIVNRMFWDHPMHLECARYALVVCPYIANPRYTGAKSRPTPEEVRVPVLSISDKKPDRFGLASTYGYKAVLFQGDTLLRAAPWTSVEWWKDGQPLALERIT